MFRLHCAFCYSHVEVAKHVVGFAGRTVMLKRVPNAYGLLTTCPHGTLLAQQRGWLKSGVNNATAITYSNADAD